jgi:hypothetical protein
MKTGTSGRVTAMMTADRASLTAMTSKTPGVIRAVDSSCGR